jgi:hypothetical protein
VDRSMEVHDRRPERLLAAMPKRAGQNGRECDWIAEPLGQAPWNGPVPGGKSD